MRKYLITFFLVFFTFSTYNCYANTFITWAWGAWNTQIWLKSWVWTNCNTNLCNITNWSDESWKSRNWTITNWAGGYVRYNTTDTLNFHPTIELNTSQINFSPTGTFENYTIFYVLKWNDISTSSSLFSDWTNEWKFEQSNNTNLYWYSYWNTNISSTLSTQWNRYQILNFTSVNRNTIDAYVETWYGKTSINKWNISNRSYLWLSRFSNSSNQIWHFYIAELLWYSSAVSSANQNIIESYLCLKYGISLDQTTPTNYTLSNSSIAWTWNTAWSYKNNITWIWRDDDTSLNQKKYQNIANSWDIIIEFTWANFANNLNTLIWANDWGSTWSWSTSDAPASHNRITREWLFSEVWDVGNVKISYPNNFLPSSVNASWWLLMFVDSDWTFWDWASIYTGTLNPITNTWDFQTNPTNWQYITFWYKIWVQKITITYNWIASWTLLPKGNNTFNYSYNDAWAWVNVAWITYSINKWNPITSSYWANIASTYINSPSISATWASLPVKNLPYWKYQTSINVPDLSWNTSTYNITFYVDEIEFNINTWHINIWKLMINSKSFSPELLVTVKTLWAGHNIFMNQSWSLNNSWVILNNWNGVSWFWYDKSPFSTNIGLIKINELIWSNLKNINVNWEKNTYIYKVKLWAFITNQEQVAWDYLTKLNFILQLNY